MSKRRVLLVDDHGIVRDGMRALLSAEPDLEVVGEAVNGRDAIHAVGQYRPDLVLLDLSMPGMNGIEALTEIKRRYPKVRVLVMTQHRTGQFIHAALKAGADGYILKGSTPDELAMAIRFPLGKTYLHSEVATEVVRAYSGGSDSSAPSIFDTLTHRERQILKLIGEQQSNRYIAEFLHISLKTVERHRSDLRSKLGLHNMAQLAAYAIDQGLVVK